MTAGRLGAGGLAAAAGLLLGLVYTASPMTVVSAAVLLVTAAWACRGLTAHERRWFVGLVTLAIALRAVVIAGLFLAADSSRPFATLFGDELFFKNRTMWMRNVSLGVPISTADFIYAYEGVGESTYLYLLAYLQAVFGAMPYGVHVMNATAYIVGVLAGYKLIRRSFGSLAALIGLALLLYWPSLFMWSVSALKEPAYSLVAIGELWCTYQIVRAPRPWQRVLAIAGVVLGAIALEGLRRGGLVIASIGVVTGLVAWYLSTRPRLALAAVVAVPIAAAILLSVSAVQDPVLSGVRRAVAYHAGHVGSEGYSYKLVEPRYYFKARTIPTMPAREAALYVINATVAYFIQPLPWQAESRLLRAYLPEQMAWFVLLAFVPIGIVAGHRRDAALTWMLAAQAFAAVVVVAMTSGNIGTLIRHRGLALPYFAWLAALGICAAFGAISSGILSGDRAQHGHP